MDVRDVRDGCATMSGTSDRGTRRLVVKVAADPHVHRFSLPMDNVQWRQARQALLAILGKAAANTALTYVDDEGDAVRVTCASEFQDAVLQLQAAGQRVLRFRAAPAATPAFVPDSPPPIPPRACGSAHGRGGTLASGSQVTPVPAPVTSTAARARRTPRDVPHREAQPRRQLKQATPSDEANGGDDDDAWVIVSWNTCCSRSRCDALTPRRPARSGHTSDVRKHERWLRNVADTCAVAAVEAEAVKLGRARMGRLSTASRGSRRRLRSRGIAWGIRSAQPSAALPVSRCKAVHSSCFVTVRGAPSSRPRLSPAIRRPTWSWRRGSGVGARVSAQRVFVPTLIRRC